LAGEIARPAAAAEMRSLRIRQSPLASLVARGWKKSESAGALLMRRQQSRDYVKEDHHRAGEQGQSDEAEADHGRIDAGVIGKAGGDAHDLGILPVEEETSVHSEHPLIERVQAIGSEVAADTSR